MMSLKEEIGASISSIFSQRWTVRQGKTVPGDSDVSMSGSVVKLEGTVLYADMKESSKLVEDVSQRVAGRIYQAFLKSSARIITEHSGTITAYDGDRIMAIFTGDLKNTNAAIVSLKINYVVSEILKPALSNHFKSIGTSEFEVGHCVGIDTGSLLAIKAGQRNANDLVWIGRAPNLAAKLSEIRNQSYTSFISEEVFKAMRDEAKYGGSPRQSMWQNLSWEYLDEKIFIYGSNWTWKI